MSAGTSALARIDVGCGDYPMRGFTAVDLYNPRAAVRAPLDDLPFAAGSVAVVHSSHSLEHVSKHAVPRVLAEWRRVLAGDGELWLEVPNLDYAAMRWLESGSAGFELDLIFGLQTDPGQEHKTGFNPAILRDFLVQAGFARPALPERHADVGPWAAPPPPWEPLDRNVIAYVWSHGQECLRVRATGASDPGSASNPVESQRSESE